MSELKWQKVLTDAQWAELSVVAPAPYSVPPQLVAWVDQAFLDHGHGVTLLTSRLAVVVRDTALSVRSQHRVMLDHQKGDVAAIGSAGVESFLSHVMGLVGVSRKAVELTKEEQVSVATLRVLLYILPTLVSVSYAARCVRVVADASAEELSTLSGMETLFSRAVQEVLWQTDLLPDLRQHNAAVAESARRSGEQCLDYVIRMQSLFAEGERMDNPTLDRCPTGADITVSSAVERRISAQFRAVWTHLLKSEKEVLHDGSAASVFTLAEAVPIIRARISNATTGIYMAPRKAAAVGKPTLASAVLRAVPGGAAPAGAATETQEESPQKRVTWAASAEPCSGCGKHGHELKACFRVHGRDNVLRATVASGATVAQPRERVATPPCTGCGKHGHVADNCFQLHGRENVIGRQAAPAVGGDSAPVGPVTRSRRANGNYAIAELRGRTMELAAVDQFLLGTVGVFGERDAMGSVPREVVMAADTCSGPSLVSRALAETLELSTIGSMRLGTLDGPQQGTQPVAMLWLCGPHGRHRIEVTVVEEGCLPQVRRTTRRCQILLGFQDLLLLGVDLNSLMRKQGEPVSSVGFLAKSDGRSDVSVSFPSNRRDRGKELSGGQRGEAEASPSFPCPVADGSIGVATAAARAAQVYMQREVSSPKRQRLETEQLVDELEPEGENSFGEEVVEEPKEEYFWDEASEEEVKGEAETPPSVHGDVDMSLSPTGGEGGAGWGGDGRTWQEGIAQNPGAWDVRFVPWGASTEETMRVLEKDERSCFMTTAHEDSETIPELVSDSDSDDDDVRWANSFGSGAYYRLPKESLAIPEHSGTLPELVSDSDSDDDDGVFCVSPGLPQVGLELQGVPELGSGSISHPVGACTLSGAIRQVVEAMGSSEEKRPGGYDVEWSSMVYADDVVVFLNARDVEEPGPKASCYMVSGKKEVSSASRAGDGDVEGWEDPRVYFRALPSGDPMTKDGAADLLSPFSLAESQDRDIELTSLRLSSGVLVDAVAQFGGPPDIEWLRGGVGADGVFSINAVEQTAEYCFLSEAKTKILFERAQLNKAAAVEASPMGEQLFARVDLENVERLKGGALVGRIRDMLEEVAFCFSKSAGLATHVPPVRIELKPGWEQGLRSHKCPHFGRTQAEVLSRYVDQCMADETHTLVPPSEARFAWRPVLSCADENATVPKIRVCNDVSDVNRWEVPTQNPGPNASWIRMHAAGHLYICTADVSCGFNNLAYEEETASLYGLWTPRGVLVPKRMIFGGRSNSTRFQEAMELALKGISELGKSVFVYIDDVVVFSDSLEEHIELVRRVCLALGTAGFRLAPHKFNFACSRAVVLGWLLTEDGLTPADHNLDKLRQLAAPESEAEMLSHFGLLQYYKTSVPMDVWLPNARVVRDLSRPLSIRASAWKSLVTAVFEAPVLAPYDDDIQLVIDVDASDLGCGAVVAHCYEASVDNEGRVCGREQPIEFHCQAFTDAQKSWPIYVREAYGLVRALDRAAILVMSTSKQVVVRTDHRPLLWMRHARSPMVARWMAQYVQGLDFRIEYRPGPKHGNADFASRELVQLELSSVSVPTQRGVLLALKTLLQVPGLPHLPNGSYCFLSLMGAETEGHVLIRQCGIAVSSPLAGSLTERALAENWDFGFVCPPAEKAVAWAAALFQSGRQFAVLVPCDLVHLLQLEGEARVRFSSCLRVVFLSDNLVWLVVSSVMAQVPHRDFVYHTEVRDVRYGLEGGAGGHGVYVVAKVPRAATCGLSPAAIVDAFRAECVDELSPMTSTATFEAAHAWVGANPPSVLKWERVGDVEDKLLRIQMSDGTEPIALPAALWDSAVQWAHANTNHAAAALTEEFVAKYYWWPGMRERVQTHVDDCTFCALAKARVSLRAVALRSKEVGRPGELLAVDFFGPLTPDGVGNCYVLVVVDLFSGYTWYLPSRAATAAVAAELLCVHVIWPRCIPKAILSDNHSVFRAKLVEFLCRDLQVEQIFTAPYSQWQNGRAERKMVDLGLFLRSLNAADLSNWGRLMALVAAQVNNRPRGAGALSAAELERPWVAYLSGEVRTAPDVFARADANRGPFLSELAGASARVVALMLKLQRESVLVDRKAALVRQNARMRGHRVFVVGDRVITARPTRSVDVSRKLLLQWRGPYVIKKIESENIFQLVNELDQSTCRASGANMILFKPSLAAALEFYRGRVGRERHIPDLQCEPFDHLLKPGSVVALQGGSHPRDKGRFFWLAKLLDIDLAMGEVTVHYFGVTRKNLQTQFRLVWVDQNDANPFVLRQSEPVNLVCKAWTGVDSLSRVFAFDIEVNANGYLTAESRRSLAGLLPVTMAMAAQMVEV